MYKKAKNFLDEVFQNLRTNNIELGSWEIDHLCYRTSSKENYNRTKGMFEDLGRCLTESEINGRPIATFKLHEPVVYKNHIIDLVEIPAPKKGGETREGFEHIESVIDMSFDAFQNQHPDCTYKRDGLHKSLNPELQISFQDCAVKLHHKSLEHIINIEKNKKVTNFLEASHILEALSGYSPCLSGSIPLDIHLDDSDLDFLFCSSDLYQFQKDVQSIFGEYEKFQVKETSHQGLASLVIKFNFHGLPIEFFCQSKNVYLQQANQHFLIEGRLLKILGKEFKDSIKRLKRSGFKTESAFGEILDLKDPYNELILLNQQSDVELKERFATPC